MVRVCAELSRLGHAVTLMVPQRTNPIQQDIFSFYGVDPLFKIIFVQSFDWMRFVRILGPFSFLLATYTFARGCVRILPKATDVVMTRDALVAYVLGGKGISCVYNAHHWSQRAVLLRMLLSHIRGVVCNSSGTAEAVQRVMDVPVKRIHNASDPNPYRGIDKETLRQELNLPVKERIVLYAGHLYGWKGFDTVLGAARLALPDPSLKFVCIGGTEQYVKIYSEKVAREKLVNVLILGQKPKAMVPKYLAAADILLLPNSARSEESVRFTSPIKLFEYLASGVPIIASDLPSIRDVVDDTSVQFVPADDPIALAQAIRTSLIYPSEAAVRAQKGLAVASEHTWEQHAEQLVLFFESVI